MNKYRIWYDEWRHDDMIDSNGTDICWLKPMLPHSYNILVKYDACIICLVCYMFRFPANKNCSLHMEISFLIRIFDLISRTHSFLHICLHKTNYVCLGTHAKYFNTFMVHIKLNEGTQDQFVAFKDLYYSIRLLLYVKGNFYTI